MNTWNQIEFYQPVKKRRRRPYLALLVAGSLLLGGVGGYTYGQSNAAAPAPYASPAAETISTGGGLEATPLSTGSGALSISEIAALNAPSVVEITTESVTTNPFFGQFVTSGAGSGVIVDSNGYIVTNNHVIEGANKISVRLKSGETYQAQLIGTDSKTDLAVIKIEATGLRAAVYGSSSTLTVGELAVVIGNPLGQLGGTVTHGIISALDREIELNHETHNLLQTDAAINPGNSGGGLFDENGKLVGIVVAKSSGEGIEGLGFAIPIDDAKDVISQLISSGYVEGRVDLGMNLVDIQTMQTALANGVSRTGVYIQSIKTGSNAEKVGLSAGDRIVSINGQTVSSIAEVNKALKDAAVGDTIDIVISRGGRSYSGSLVLTQATQSGQATL